MLCIARKVRERIRLHDTQTGVECWVTVMSVRGDKVRIGIDAPANVVIHREELLADDA